MRLHMIGVLLALVTTPSMALAQLSPLRVGAEWFEYCGHVYTARPASGSRVFFVGEPLRLRVGIKNVDLGESHSWAATDQSQSDIVAEFSVVARRFPVPIPERLEGEPALIGMQLESSMLRVEGEQRVPAVWNSQIQLNPNTVLLWEAELVGATQPGAYRVDIGLRGADEDGRASVSTALDFEVRAPTDANRFELVRRAACADMLARRYGEAEAGARRLLALLPDAWLSAGGRDPSKPMGSR